ncbi:MAG: hypothetical protein R6W88_08445 [Desulfobacterales bacterium]
MIKPAPRVVTTALNDYNIAMELQVWIDDERRHVEKRFELREKAFNTLTQACVELPFETLQLQPVEVKMQRGRGGNGNRNDHHLFPRSRVD